MRVKMQKAGVSLPPSDWDFLDRLAGKLTRESGRWHSRPAAIRHLIRERKAILRQNKELKAAAEKAGVLFVDTAV